MRQAGIVPSATAEKTTMKSPAKEAKQESVKFERLKGDGLDLRIPLIRENRWVVGDGCRIVVERNDAVLRVTGDGCQVRVNRNLGTVEYIGDGGHVILGSETVDATRVSYKGDGGLVEIAGVRQNHEEKPGTKVRKGKIVITRQDDSKTKERDRMNISLKGVVNWSHGKVSTKELRPKVVK